MGEFRENLFLLAIFGLVLLLITTAAQPLVRNGDGFYESGDIRFHPDHVREGQLRGGWQNTARWPNGVVTYRLDPTFTAAQRAEIFKAMSELSSKTCIRFQERTNQPDYVNLVKASGGGCWSLFGRVGGGQTMNLEPFCIRQVTVIHEFIHALGFIHEQSRPDRDNHLTVNWANIIPDQRHNFRKFSASEINTYGTPYDFASIMHYPPYAFAINPNIPTLTPKDSRQKICGECQISRWDAYEINAMYKGICPTRRG